MISKKIICLLLSTYVVIHAQPNYYQPRVVRNYQPRVIRRKLSDHRVIRNGQQQLATQWVESWDDSDTNNFKEILDNAIQKFGNDKKAMAAFLTSVISMA